MRRRHFRKLVRVWRYSLERLPDNAPEVVWSAYEKIAVEIMSESILVDGDFRLNAAFMASVRAAGEMTRSEAEAEARNQGASLREALRYRVKAIGDIVDQG